MPEVTEDENEDTTVKKNKEGDRSTASQKCVGLRQNMAILWDGLTFFSFDLTRIQNVQSKNPYLNKFRNIKWLLYALLFIFIVAYILYFELRKLGQNMS